MSEVQWSLSISNDNKIVGSRIEFGVEISEQWFESDSLSGSKIGSGSSWIRRITNWEKIKKSLLPECSRD